MQQSENSRRRWLLAPPIGVLAVLLLFMFLKWAITARELPPQGESPSLGGIAIIKPADTPEQPPDPLQLPQNTPPPPPNAPPSLAQPALPGIAAPALSNVAIDAGPVNVAVNVNTTGLGLGSGAFGGFLRGGGGAGGGSGGAGTGGGGSGIATGQSFKGRDLVPLSTARPQMPDWACKQKIKGWVEVVFVVLPNGRVSDVRIVDADPRGVYEAAAIESVSNWIYAEYPKARSEAARADGP